MWWWVVAAWAGSPVVALGDGGTAPANPVTGGWVTVLADCLEERAPGQFSVVDRTIASNHKGVAVAELGAAAIVVALGPDDTPIGAFRRELGRLIRSLRDAAPQIVLVGIAPPSTGDAARAAAWNAAVASAAQAEPGVRHVDLLADWPVEEAARAALTTDGILSDQGHARIAAAVCDTLLRK